MRLENDRYTENEIKKMPNWAECLWQTAPKQLIIMIRTRSQMENKTHEKVFQEGRRTKRAHWLTSLRTLHKDETRKKLPKFMYVA